MWSRRQSCLEQAAQQPMGSCSGPIRSSCTAIGPLCCTVQMCKGPTRHCVGITLWYAASAAPKGFAQRTHLGPLSPRHGRVTFSPSLRGCTWGGHTLERCREAPSSRGRAAAASNPLAHQPCCYRKCQEPRSCHIDATES